MQEIAPPRSLDLVIPRQEREKAIDRLTRHFVADDLSLEQFESRLDHVHSAESAVELQTVFNDLTLLEDHDQVQFPMTVDDAPERGWSIALLGSASRKGRWRVPRVCNVVALMGGAELDLREASFGPGVTEVRVFAMMGGVEILVPPHVAVEANGVGIMGGFDDMSRSPPNPSPELPRLRITGAALMGGVEIETRLPGESRRASKKRVKAELKARSAS